MRCLSLKNLVIEKEEPVSTYVIAVKKSRHFAGAAPVAL